MVKFSRIKYISNLEKLGRKICAVFVAFHESEILQRLRIDRDGIVVSKVISFYFSFTLLNGFL